MIGDVDEWFIEQRSWTKADINSKLTSKLNIDFKVVMQDPNHGEVVWEGKCQ